MVAKKGALEVSADLKKNRLYITAAGRVVKKELDSFYTDLRFLVADFQSAFDLIIIYSDCRIANLNILPTFIKIIHFLMNSGLREVVRIMPAHCVFKKQLINLTERMSGYKPLYATSLPEAESLLDALRKRESLRFYFHHLSAEYELEGGKGKGQLENVSVSGCLLSQCDLLPSSIGQQLQIKIEFARPDGNGERYEMVSEVVRMIGTNGFAVHFQKIEKGSEGRLLQDLIAECQVDLS